MVACIWENLKFHFGFWGAMAVLGLIVAAIGALTASTGGAGTAALTTGISAALASGGLAVATAGGTGLIGTLVGGIALCLTK